MLKNLVELKKLNLIKVNLFKRDFLTFKAKKAFIHLQKSFIKALFFIIFKLRLIFQSMSLVKF